MPTVISPGKKRKLTAFLLAACLTWPGLSSAAEADQPPAAPAESTAADAAKEMAVPVEIPTFFLNEMVVTASRVPVDAFHANANINVVSREQIENGHYSDLSEALRDVPGVDIRNYGAPGYTSSTLTINGSSNVVILIDGVKQNNSLGAFVATAIRNMENIERIEVLKGSASTLYGADAKGGVINIITKKPDGVKTTLKTETGSYRTENYYLSHEGRQKDWSWSVHLDKQRLGDFDDAHHKSQPSASDMKNVSLKIIKDFGKKHDLSLSYDSYRADYKYKAIGDPSPSYAKADNSNLRLILNSRFDDKISNQFSIARISYDHDAYGSISQKWVEVSPNNWAPGPYVVMPYRNKVTTLRISDQLTAKLSDKNTFIAGFEYTRDQLPSYAHPLAYGGYLQNFGVRINNKSLFIQDQHNFTDKWKLTAGVRFDRHSTYGSHTSPSANLSYDFNDKTNMYVGYSKYLLTPDPFSLYDPYRGNKDLQPEKGDTREIGLNHRFSDTFVLSAHVFYRHSTNKTGFDSLSNSFINLPNEKTRGWDIQLKKKFGKYYTASVGYTHTNMDKMATTTGIIEPNYDGSIPKGSWKIGLAYDHDKWNTFIAGRGIINRPGPRIHKSTGNPCISFPTSTYWVFDLGVNYKVSDNFKVYAKLNNIFNQYYAEQSDAYYNTPNEWYAARGRNILVGMQYSF